MTLHQPLSLAEKLIEQAIFYSMEHEHSDTKAIVALCISRLTSLKSKHSSELTAQEHSLISNHLHLMSKSIVNGPSI